MFELTDKSSRPAPAQRSGRVAGQITATCTCCAPPHPLAADPRLEDCRRCCPHSGLTYLDRGDAVYEQDGERLTPAASDAPPEHAAPPDSGLAKTDDRPDTPALLSDRPLRTGPKTRIALERATFAAARERGAR